MNYICCISLVLILIVLLGKILWKFTTIVKTMYKKEFDKNLFYYPRFINRSYKRDFFQIYMENVLNPFKKLIKN